MFDVKKYISLARQVVAEGSVLIKNDRAALPLAKGCKVASFGRSQLNYYKSGTGSGGLVNTAYVVSILDALKNSEDLILNENVLKTYEDWVVDHPFDNGVGWATEPWCQKEMPLDEAFVKKVAEESDVAVITIARTAGEDKDNSATEGSYMLTAEEEKMLEVVCRYFEKTIVVLNVGAIIDMKWVKTYDPAAVLYVWQGGQEGGNGVLDLLTGKVSPSGKLADTISEDITDNPSTANFGNPDNNIYAEDIYVGYRYFESFAKDKVVYPFGFGLSYTTFAMKAVNFSWDGDKVAASVEVTNSGAVAGKEVVQLYVSAPQGKIGKAARVLCGFAKTKELAPGESEVLTITCGKYYLASYDDSGLSGYKSAYVLEHGTYTFYAGSDVRCEMIAGTFELAETVVVDQLTPAMSPVVAFERMRAVETEKGLEVGYEPAPLREYNLWARINENRPADIEYTGDKGYKLADVKSGKVTMEEFVAQIPVEQLAVMLRGEGMCSPKVTPGTGGAFGGLSSTLGKFGIPIACCTDGPSGLRMDVGTLAFSIPNGACLACTFNEQLSIDLFDIMGVELRKNKIDTLLGPGMNLHRNPLNGRNFEYFSEDPFLTGKMASAQLKGMQKHNVTGTIKHFIGNNQEFKRHFANGIVSERALRELYLKSFEIACKEGGAKCIMSTYGSINGFWTASNYDLLTHILRKEWGYKGLVMSDWWAKGNEEGEEGTLQENAAMVRSQNDMFMVVSDSEGNSNNDNILESVGTPKLTLGEVQRGAMNVLRVVIDMPVMDRWLDCEEECYKALYEHGDGYETGVEIIDIDVNELGGIPVELIPTETGSRPKYNLIFKEYGTYRAEITMRSNAYSDLAQLPVSVFKNGKLVSTISMKGTDIEWTTTTINIGLCNCNSIILEMFFIQTGLEVQSCKIYQV